MLLVSRARLRTVNAGETIFLMGDPGDNMMAVLEGDVRISVPSPDGKALVLAMIRAGEFFGEIALLDGKERTTDATAISTCRLAILNRRDVLSFLEVHPNAWPPIVDVLCERLRRTTVQIAEVALLEIPVRLAKAILRIARGGSGLATVDVKSEINLSQRELGNIVGATRESVNKCFGEWQREGIIRIESTVIRIINRPALQRLADSD
jgi:CRP/FNR family cyclic AMP-dependent transcriptional regulator